MEFSIPSTEFSIATCIAAFFWLFFMLRSDSASLGLPIAFLFSLLLIHVPGAYAHFGGDSYTFTPIGIMFTAIASVSFLGGAWAVRLFSTTGAQPVVTERDERRFSLFVLIGGWFFTYALSSFYSIYSLGLPL